jgi:hypothetical protein
MAPAMDEVENDPTSPADLGPRSIASLMPPSAELIIPPNTGGAVNGIPSAILPILLPPRGVDNSSCSLGKDEARVGVPGGFIKMVWLDVDEGEPVIKGTA